MSQKNVIISNLTDAPMVFPDHRGSTRQLQPAGWQDSMMKFVIQDNEVEVAVKRYNALRESSAGTLKIEFNGIDLKSVKLGNENLQVHRGRVTEEVRQKAKEIHDKEQKKQRDERNALGKKVRQEAEEKIKTQQDENINKKKAELDEEKKKETATEKSKEKEKKVEKAVEKVVAKREPKTPEAAIKKVEANEQEGEEITFDMLLKKTKTELLEMANVDLGLNVPIDMHETDLAQAILAKVTGEAVEEEVEETEDVSA